MKHPLTITFAAALLLLQGGCALKMPEFTPAPKENAYVPFTKQLNDRFCLDPQTLKQVQFYTSGKIVLEKMHHSQSCGVDKGVLVTKSSAMDNRIVIAPHTPGIVTGSGKGYLLVSFEPGKSLKFMKTCANCGKTPGRYKLAAKRWENGIGEIDYAGESYRAQPGSGGVFLMVAKQDLSDRNISERLAKGCLLP